MFLFSLFFSCPCMAINLSVQYNGGLFPDIILLTPFKYHKRFCICSLWSHLNVLTFFPLPGGCSEGLGAFWFFFKHSESTVGNLDVGTWVRISVQSHEPKCDFTVDERKGRLNPSRDKNEGKHRRRKVEKSCVTPADASTSLTSRINGITTHTHNTHTRTVMCNLIKGLRPKEVHLPVFCISAQKGHTYKTYGRSTINIAWFLTVPLFGGKIQGNTPLGLFSSTSTPFWQ